MPEVHWFVLFTSNCLDSNFIHMLYRWIVHNDMHLLQLFKFNVKESKKSCRNQNCLKLASRSGLVVFSCTSDFHCSSCRLVRNLS